MRIWATILSWLKDHCLPFFRLDNRSRFSFFFKVIVNIHLSVYHPHIRFCNFPKILIHAPSAWIFLAGLWIEQSPLHPQTPSQTASSWGFVQQGRPNSLAPPKLSSESVLQMFGHKMRVESRSDNLYSNWLDGIIHIVNDFLTYNWIDFGPLQVYVQGASLGDTLHP